MRRFVLQDLRIKKISHKNNLKMKKTVVKVIVIIAIVFAVLFIGLFLLAIFSPDDEGEEDSTGKTELNYQNDTGSVDDEEKDTIINGKPYGEPDTTWTVMMYLCGTDLESRYGFASSNLGEICNASLGDNVNYIIETGGAKAWQTGGISNRKLSRFHVKNGEILIDETCPSSSMGDADTLKDFIKWGASKYPADRYMLILWDHGGGSLFGICLDELYNDDALSLKEVETAIANAKVPFEVAGFDACLMSSLETAEAFQGYAHYMVASEETEPGTGWDYNAWINYLSENTGCSGKELGREIVDSYMDKCASIGQEDMATLSVCDLTRLPALSEAFRNYSGELVMTTQNVSDFQAVVQEATQSESYGERTGADGTYDMVDLGDLMNKTGGILTEYSDDVLNAIEKVVVYESHGMYRSRASGLSVFYPKYIDSDIYKAYEDITDNTAYLEYASVVNGEWDQDSWETVWTEAYEDYNSGGWYSGGLFDSLFSSGGYEDEYEYSDDDGYYEEDQEEPEEAEEYDVQESSGSFMNGFFGNSNSVESVDLFQNLHPVQPGDEQMAYKQYLDEDNTLNMQLTSGLDVVKNVRFTILYMQDEDNCLYMGSDDDINADYERGEFSDNFRGTWMTIGGEYVCAELIDSTDDYYLYVIPAKVNGEETYLRAVYEFDREEYRVLGTYDGEYEDTNLSGRNIHPLKSGDKVDFIFYSFDMNEDEDDEGTDQITASIVWSDDTDMMDEEMDDGKFYYMFVIEDIFGNETYCDPVIMEIQDGETFTYEIEG